MRLPDTEHTTRPWKIGEIAPEFRLEDVWALPTPGSADDFPRLVEQFTSFDPIGHSPAVVRALFAIRFAIGRVLGWDSSRRGEPAPTLRDRLHGGLERPPRRDSAGTVQHAVSNRRRMGGRNREPNGARRAPSWLGSDAQRRVPRPNGRSGQAEWTARRGLHDRDHALPVPGRLPGDAARARTPVATTAARTEIGPGPTAEDYAVSVIGRSTQLIRSRSFLPVISIGCSALRLRSSSSSLLPPSMLATSFLTKRAVLNLGQ